MTKQLKKIDIEEIKEEYQPVFDLFTDEDDMVYRIKVIISKMDEVSKRIILMYTHLQSQRKVAKLLGISTSLCNLKINEIRRRIKNELHN